jgi:hypothetical protein
MPTEEENLQEAFQCRDNQNHVFEKRIKVEIASDKQSLDMVRLLA